MNLLDSGRQQIGDDIGAGAAKSPDESAGFAAGFAQPPAKPTPDAPGAHPDDDSVAGEEDPGASLGEPPVPTPAPKPAPKPLR